MQEPKSEEGGNFTMLASTNTESLQLADQGVVCKQGIEYKLTLELVSSRDGLCGYNKIPTQSKQMVLRVAV